MKTIPAVRFALIYVLLVVVALGYFMLPSRKVDGSRLPITTPRPTNKHTTTEMTTVKPVVNPHLFKFTIHNQAACFNRNNSQGALFLVLLVKCAPFEKLDRQQIRKTWGGVKEVLGRRVLTMFLLGESTDPHHSETNSRGGQYIS